MKRIELTLIVTMLAIGAATSAAAQPVDTPARTHDTTVQIVDCEASVYAVVSAAAGRTPAIPDPEVAKAVEKVEGMSWTEVTIVRALLAFEAQERALERVARDDGTRLLRRG